MFQGSTIITALFIMRPASCYVSANSWDLFFISLLTCRCMFQGSTIITALFIMRLASCYVLANSWELFFISRSTWYVE